MAHIPVLLDEVLDLLDPKPGQVMVDGTAGGGGHTIPIAKALAPGGSMIAIDWDKKRIDDLNQKLSQEDLDLEKLVLVQSNYADLPDILKEESLGGVDGLLVDLGFSSDQLGEGRGFNFKGEEEPLVMTYDNDAQPLYQLLPQLGQNKLTEIIRDLSDERYARRIAKALVEAMRKEPITTNHQLADVIRASVPRGYEKGRIDPATRTFMALRIYINRELENLGKLLGSLEQVMNKDGVVTIITFHSKEDAIVKSFFKGLAQEGRAELLNKKVIKASRDEVESNPRSRSAKLRGIRIIK